MKAIRILVLIPHIISVCLYGLPYMALIRVIFGADMGRFWLFYSASLMIMPIYFVGEIIYHKFADTQIHTCAS